jgi:hypothetical protein
MAQQTTECAYFIRDYAKKGFCMLAYTVIQRNLTFLLGKRAVENTFSQTVDTKIQDYESKFKNLKDAFQGRAVLETEIIVSRMLGTVTSLGKQFHQFMNTPA